MDPTQMKQFAPKRIGINDLYKHSTGTREVSTYGKSMIAKALTEAGYDQATISKISSGTRLDKSTITKVVEDLGKAKVFGFEKAGYLVKDYVHHETKKRQNIATISKERTIEAINQGGNESTSTGMITANKKTSTQFKTKLGSIVAGSASSGLKIGGGGSKPRLGF